ncbi:MAG: M3 family metallopeptidase [Saprospiraceae bacterium]|nr:M3 family metallopeptidase [Saprospiraceae bacterium]
MVNPFYESYSTPFEVPPFDIIKSVHIKPAVLKAIREHEDEIQNIINNNSHPDFLNTIVAIDNSGDALLKVTGVMYNLSNAHTNSELEKISSELTPILSTHNDSVYFNEALFERVKHVWLEKEQSGLNPEELKLLEKYFKNFERNGALLTNSKKLELTSINEKLSRLTLRFAQNSLLEVNTFKYYSENIEELAGIPQDIINVAAGRASKEGFPGKWLFTLHLPSVMPVLKYADNRAFREKIWRAFVNKGNNGNESDNNELIKEIIDLRDRKAKLLGYQSHAQYILEEQMAKTPETVINLIQDLWKPAIEVASDEASEMQEYIYNEGNDFKLQPHDWRYYAEKIRKSKYDLDETEVKEFFSLKNVLNGVFEVCNRLFGLRFELNKDLPVYQEDVIGYEVRETDGTLTGILFLDFYFRESKRSGAWMTSYREQKKENGNRIVPVISIVCNFSKPMGNLPTLLTFDEVIAFFHEFGHALHGLLSDVTFTSLSGTNVPTDFVELPSQIMENWATESEVLKLIGYHFKTNEVIPDDLIQKIKSSEHYGQGFATTEYLAATFLDMEFHTNPDIAGLSVGEFEKKSMLKLGLNSEILPRYRSTYFNHIFAGGYSAGYYSYIWSQVLDADAFEAFRENGIFDSQTASRFRKLILEKGGTEDPLELFKKFRGREPDIQPLIKKRGLVQTAG